MNRAAHLQATDYYGAVMRCQYAEARRLETLSQSRRVWRRGVRLLIPRLRQTLRLAAWCADSVLSSIRTIGALAEFLPHCEAADVVCFDVFDTLLYRTVEPPDFLKRRAANYAAQLLSRHGFPVTRDIYLHMRDEAEARLRARARRSGMDAECKLSEIIHETLKSLLGSDIALAETEKLVRYEIEVECHHLRAAQGACELLDGLRSRGKRVIVASDTYLEKPHTEQIFKHVGLDGYIDSVYLSSEFAVGKYSGKLFRKILESEHVEAQNVIHVGDNYESDVRGAVKAGLRAVFLRDLRRLRCRRRSARLTRRALAGRAVAPLVSPFPAASPQSDGYRDADGLELFKIGSNILGPAFCLFVLQVIETCHQLGVNDVYYLARDGLLFRRIHDTLTENIHRFQCLPRIRHHYLYVSRLATSLPSIRELGDRELALALYRHRGATLEECIRAFGLEPSEYSDLLDGLQSNDPIAKQRLFSDPHLAERLQSLAATERSKLRCYLAQEGFFGTDEIKALADIGWSATIQANLTRAFHDDPEFPMLIGLYFGRRYNHDDDYNLSFRSLFAPGLFFDQHRDDSAEQTVGTCLEIFELAASAPHGATLGYEETDGVVKPVLNQSPTTLSREQKLLQDGIMTHALAFSKAYNDYELDASLLRKHAARAIAMFLRKPTLAQVKALSGLTHSVDWGSGDSRPLIATGLTPRAVFTPRRLIHTLLGSCWLEGGLRMLRLPGLLLLLSLVRRAREVNHVLLRVVPFCLNLFRRKPTTQ